LNHLSESLDKLWERLMFINQLHQLDFVRGGNINNNQFDFYSEQLNVGIVIDAYSYCYDEFYNQDDIKLFTVATPSIKVIKLTDYQILIDLDHVIRFMNAKVLKGFASNKLIA